MTRRKFLKTATIAGAATALPLTLATAHNGVAALLLLATVRMNRLLR